MGVFDGRETRGRKPLAVRNDHLVDHRVAAEGVAEREGICVLHEDLRGDGSSQSLDHRALRKTGRGGQERPVEASSQHGRRFDRETVLRVEGVETAGDAVGERHRHPCRHLAAHLPPVVVADEGVIVHQPSEQLLDDERHALRLTSYDAEKLGRHHRGVEAHRHHAVDLVRAQSAELDDARAATLAEPAPAALDLMPLAGSHRSDTHGARATEVVAQVLHHSQGLGVGPVEILEHEQRASSAIEGHE